MLTIHGLKILVYLYFENSTSKLVFENDVFAKFNLTNSFLHLSYECFIAMFIAVLFSFV